ncbi:MAG TPA: hypothetical protein VMI06_19005 [Terriglobia bacterium]|nr:hypothetical protein [Terriglobia bacterium]
MQDREIRNGVLPAVIIVAILLGCVMSSVYAVPRRKKKEKNGSASSNGPTAQLFDVLNSSFGGKLNNFYLLADVYSDPSNPGQQYQRVLNVDYDKSLYFGRFVIHARSVRKMTPEQLAIYDPKQVYSFGGRDGQVFDKINPGPFGSETGDLYLAPPPGGGPLRTVPIDDSVTQEYQVLVSQYILPAVKKLAAQKQ